MWYRWAGLVLVDPPIQDVYISLRPSKYNAVIYTPSTPLFGGTEDFLSTASPASPGAPSAGQSMLDELLHYWKINRPENFSPEKLTLRALSYYPLRIIAAEWVNYIALMCICARQYDNPPSASSTLSKDLKQMDLTLLSISSWPRRVISSMTSLRKCIAFIKCHGQDPPSSESWTSLQEDYEHLAYSLVQEGKLLEATIPLVTAYLQLTESRRAYVETNNVSRLTVLAFIFVPLSFVTSLFSMSEDIRPGGTRFWLYFAVALPILGLVILAARPAISISNLWPGHMANSLFAFFTTQRRKMK